MSALESDNPESRKLSWIELQRRVALPVSALIFAILGVTFGIQAPRGGRGYGFVASIIIAFTYYAVFATGIELAEMGKLPVSLGVWGANILLGTAAALSIHYTERTSDFLLRIIHSGFVSRVSDQIRKALSTTARLGGRLFETVKKWSAFPFRFRLQLTRVIDLYVIRTFLRYFTLTLAICVALFYLFTFFELVDDIVSNNIAYALIFDYFFYLLPHILMLLVPISVLIATLVTFGLLDKTNQIIALKSCGMSVYRVALPLLALILLLSGFIFILQEYLLPYANQRQDNLRNIIKGRPVQTHYQVGHNWIFGEDNRLYNYNYLDPEDHVFAELALFRLDIARNQLYEHTYARRATWDSNLRTWVLHDGWRRRFEDDRIEFSYFDETTLDLSEDPSYFAKEVKESSKMTYLELKEYIEELRQGGFEVDHLRTELYKKISFPLVSLIMVVLGVPFAFTIGKKGALHGVAAGILIGITYWGTFGAFGVLGSNGLLSPILAAWGPNILFGAGSFLFFSGVRT